MNRREILAGSALASLAACAPKSKPATKDTASKRLTFVLVHGTWHGGWVWKDVRNILADMGHRVFTPTLTGCGEREHLSSPDVGLDTHIQDIINVIEFEDLSDVVLVGHSFTGVAITGVADRLKDRIKHICFFDALVPFGDRMSGTPRNPDGSLEDYFLTRQTNFIGGYKMDLWADYPLKMLLPEDHPKAAWVRSKITTHPAKSWTDILALKNGGWDDMSRSFVHCIGQEFAMSSEKMVGPAREPGWEFLELNIPRDGMVTHPALVADTFLRLATS